MTELEKLKARIEDAIHANNQGEITGDVLQETLLDMVDTISENANTDDCVTTDDFNEMLGYINNTLATKQDAITNGTVVQVANDPSAQTRRKFILTNEMNGVVSSIVTSSDVNSGWEQGGDSRLATIGLIKGKLAEKVDSSDLEDYYTKDEVDQAIENIDVTEQLADVATSGSYDDLTNKPTLQARVEGETLILSL